MTKQEITDSGFKMSANARPEEVERCAGEVLRAYMLPLVASSEVEEAAAGSVIHRAWAALTFLRYMQDVEFGTRTGGERKRFDYGERLQEAKALKATCAQRLKELEQVRTQQGQISDICGVYFKTQLFY